MDFTTFSFGLFFVVVLTSYWLVTARWRWLVLLLASYMFLSWWYLALPALVLAMTLLSFAGGLVMERWPKFRHLTLGLTTLSLLSVLFFYKYLGFLASTWPQLAQPVLDIAGVNVASILLPVGISFYTFQLLAYLVDVNIKKIPAEKHLGGFLLFALFFPKFVAGPIEKAQHLIPQFFHTQRFSHRFIVDGLMLFSLGLFKKIVVADNLALVVNRVFDSLPEYRGLSLVLVIFLYAWQIYADFSGYTDMARGVAKTFGIDLWDNFNQPYFATSLRDFWRKWHITLSGWLREYIYFPLGGSRVSMLRTMMNTLVVFVVCGLWHGAAWTFVVWGVWHGVWVALENLVTKILRWPFKVPPFVGMVYTFGLVCVGWVFFRAISLSDAWYIITNAPTGLRHFVNPNYVVATLDQMFASNYPELGITVAALVGLITWEVLQLSGRTKLWWYAQPALLRWAGYSLLVFVILLLRNPKVQTFIYVQF